MDEWNECMETNVLNGSLDSSLTLCFTRYSFLCTPRLPYFASGLRPHGIIDSITDFPGISLW